MTRHAVIIASARRPQVLHETIISLLKQQPRPHQIVIAVSDTDDILPESAELPGMHVITARRGLTCARNDAIAALLPDIEVATFLDDDVELAPDYLAKARMFLASHPEVVLLNGRLLKNGNVTRTEAVAMIDKTAGQTPDESFSRQRGAYGCNMTLRRGTLTRVQFDERFRSNGWLEDADFSMRCGQQGILATYHGCQLVHLMVEGGRVSGARMGFSQIMNPYYLYRKRLVKRGELALQHWIPALRNNLLKLLLLDRKVDRLGRLRGNLTAFSLIVQGRCEPEYVERLP